MRRKIIIALAVLLMAALAVGITAFVYSTQEIFNGERIKNPDSYILVFDRMNQSDSHTLSLKEGEGLCVEFAIEKGRVDLVVENSHGSVIYRGNKIDSGIFDLIIPADGDYTILVNAKNAKGFIMASVSENG